MTVKKKQGVTAEELKSLRGRKFVYDIKTGKRFEFYKIDLIPSLGEVRVIVHPPLTAKQKSRKQQRPIHFKKFDELSITKPERS